MENDSIAVGEITDRALRTIGKTKRHQDVVSAIAARVAEGPRFDLDYRRCSQKHQQIDKVADLAKNAAASLLAIVDPMVGRKISGIDAIVERQRLGNRCEERFHPRGHGCETAIESDHQRGPLGGGNSEICGDNRMQLFFRQTKRLLAEHMLSGCERGQNLLRMQVMASGDDYGVDGGVVNELRFIGRAIWKPNLRSACCA